MKKRTSIFLGALPFVALVASCNLIIGADTMSCETDDDCVNFTNHICSEGTCVSQDVCSSNSECAADEICRPVTPRVCEKIRQGACQELYPDNDTFRDDNAILIGLTAPLTVEASTGQSIANGAKLAVDDFNVDGGVQRERPLVLVLCDDKAEAQNAYDNGVTLAKMGIQVLIGPAFSGQTIQTAGTSAAPGTVANNMVLFSPSATSPLVTGIGDKSPACAGESDCPGLVWRTSPSDTFQGAALSQYFPTELEPVIRNRGGVNRPASFDLTVWVLYKPDSYGQLLAEVLQNSLVFNGTSALSQQGTSFFIESYGDADPVAEGVQPDLTVLDTAIADAPDAVFLIGTGEVAEIMRYFEQTWSGSDADRPYYVFGDGGLGGPVADAVRGGNAIPTVPPALPVIERVRGSIPGQSKSTIFEAYRADYNQRFPSDESGHGPNIFGAAGAFDIVYMIAYSAIAARGEPLTGDVLARGFARLADTEATEVKAGSVEIGKAEQALSQPEGTINFEGASGSLDFDVVTGEAPSPIQVWCVPPVGGEAGINTGLFWDTDMIGLPEPERLGVSYTCPFHTCAATLDCETNPVGHACIQADIDVCGCTSSADCDVDDTCNTELAICE